jgi:hypothetical protein
MFKSFPKSLPTLKSLPQAIGLPFLSTQEDAQLRFRSGENGIKRLYGDEVCLLQLVASSKHRYARKPDIFIRSADGVLMSR